MYKSILYYNNNLILSTFRNIYKGPEGVPRRLRYSYNSRNPSFYLKIPNRILTSNLHMCLLLRRFWWLFGLVFLSITLVVMTMMLKDPFHNIFMVRGWGLGFYILSIARIIHRSPGPNKT